MNASLRDRIVRKIETLSDERGYQVLDYVEFLESKYAERQAASPSIFQRFAEGVEDTLRAGRVSTTAVAETMSLLNRAMGVLSGVAAAGKSVATDIASAATAATAAATKTVTGPGTSATAADTTSASPDASAPASRREGESGTPSSQQDSQ